MRRNFRGILLLLIVLSIMFGSMSTVFASNMEDYYLKKIEEKLYNPQNGIYKFENGFVAEKKDGKIRLLNKEGKEIVPYIYDAVNQFGFENGFLAVMKDGKWGFINELGEEIVPTIYDNVGTMDNDFMVIINNNKWGLLNKEGKMLLPAIYGSINFYNYGLISIEKDGKWGVINELGEELVPVIYDRINPDYKGFIAIKKDDKWGLLSKGGKEILPPIYDNIVFDNGFIAIKKDGKYGLANKSGKIIADTYYLGFHFLENGLIGLYRDNKQGIINQSGEELVPVIYEKIAIQDIDKGIVTGYKDGNETVFHLDVSKFEEQLNSSDYDFIGDFIDGFAIVAKEERWGIINESGKEIVPTIYDLVSNFKDGYAIVNYNNKYGFVNELGEEVIPTIYDNGYRFQNGIARVMIQDKWGAINESGEIIVPIIYDNIEVDKDENFVGYINGVKKVIVIEGLLNQEEKESKEDLIATSTNANVLVNNLPTKFEAYTINGNNYFKLRDLAKVISGSEKQFEVQWDNDKKAINLISNKPYTIVGGEMIQGNGQEKNAKANTSKIYINGKEVNLTAYTIGENNYFKLRDIAKAFDIGITWDGETKTIGIDTTISYIEE